MDLASKRVCVTGGAGFLGSFLVQRLKAHGVRDVFTPTFEGERPVTEGRPRTSRRRTR